MAWNETVAVITGASSGLGRACATRLHELGAQVVLADVAPAGREVAAKLSDRATFVPTDVTDEASVQSLISRVAEIGPLRVAIQCAGVIHAQRVVGREAPYDLDAFRRVVEVNLIGTFNVMRLAAQHMATLEPVDDQRGVIINTSSVAAFEGQVGQCAYSASKGGVASMTLPAARDLARHGIRVCAIAPGVFDTPMMAAMPDSVRESLEAQVPFPSRLGKPEEFAAMAQHIIENKMCNGSVLRLDGAARLP